jgi:CDP-glucose 4,6-dehydratase
VVLRTALVTGASGMLGARLSAALADDGVRVLAVVRAPGAADERLDVVHADVTDAASLTRAFGAHDVDTVFHLAAQPIVGPSASAVATFETNVAGTWNVLEAARAAGVARVVVAGSSAAYGAGGSPSGHTEEDPLWPRDAYGASKAAAEVIARSYWHEHGLPVAITRAANVYGPGDRQASRLVPELVAAVGEARRPVIRSDGSPERDFLYVDDAVAAYLEIARALDGAGPARGEAYNIGGGRPVSVREVAETLLRVAGSDAEPEYRGGADRSPGRHLDCSKLAAHTGWEPRVSLEEGLRRTLEASRRAPARR